MLRYFTAGLLVGLAVLFWWPQFFSLGGGTASEQILAFAPTAQPQFKVGLQAGHWQQDQVPAELAELKAGNLFILGMRHSEAAITLKLAKAAAAILLRQGLEVEVLPSTVPPGYKADAFVTIHADWSFNPLTRGFKAAPSSFAQGELSARLNAQLLAAYGQLTGLPRQDEGVTAAMREYYAFNFNKFEHALDPSTPAVIIETGFMTNWQDRELLENNSELVAQGIAEGMENFLSANLKNQISK